MPIDDSGISKPFDRILKAFVDEAPELFVRLLGIVPPDTEFRLSPLRPETAPAVIMPDFVASLEVGSSAPILLHIEFQVAYHSGIPAAMARYGGSLAWQYGCEVLSLLVHLRRRGVPETIPAVGEFRIGSTVTTHPFRSIRLWELDPTLLLETGDPRLLPWSVLMKSSDETVRRVAAVLAREGHEESIGRFLALGGLRYHRSLLERMLGDPRMGLLEAIVEGSSIFEEARQKAEAQGRAQGQAEGRAQGQAEGRAEGQELGRTAEARTSLRIALKAKFPGLETAAEIDSIAAPETLESLLELTVLSSDRPEVERAIFSALRPH